MKKGKERLIGDGDGPNLCRVKKKMLVPHLLKIYFGLGWPLSVLEIVSSQRLKTMSPLVLKKKNEKFLFLNVYWHQVQLLKFSFIIQFSLRLSNKKKWTESSFDKGILPLNQR